MFCVWKSKEMNIGSVIALRPKIKCSREVFGGSESHLDFLLLALLVGVLDVVLIYLVEHALMERLRNEPRHSWSWCCAYLVKRRHARLM
jgi:hypothetical protein